MAFQTDSFQSYYNRDLEAQTALGMEASQPQKIEWRRQLGGQDATDAKTNMEDLYKQVTGLPLITAEDRHRFKHWVEDFCPDKGQFYE